MTKQRKRFEGGYVRGGAQTLYMTRSDLIQAIAIVKVDYPGNIREIMKEAEIEASELQTLRDIEVAK